MIPTCASTSGTSTGGAPTIQDIPALDMSSYTVYEWMEAEDGLGLVKPATAKMYAMIYQASMHYRGYFAIDQGSFAQQMGTSRQTVNKMLAKLVEAGLVVGIDCGGNEGCFGGRLRGQMAYFVAQEPVNRAILTVTERKRSQALTAWAQREPEAPAPDWLQPSALLDVEDNPQKDQCGKPQTRVIHNAQLANVVKKLDNDFSCGNPATENHTDPPGKSEGAPPVSTCADVEKPQVTNVVKKLDNDFSCGNGENAQVEPLSKNLTTAVKKLDNDFSCGNVKCDTCLSEPSTCGSDDKTAGYDFDQRYIEDRGERIEVDSGIRRSNNNVSPSSPYLSVGAPSPGDPAALSPQAHEDLARFLAHWPKKAGNAESFEMTARAWGHAIEMGYTPDEIMEAGMAYVDDFLSSQEGKPNLWYLKFPSTFLTKQDGLALWARKIRTGKPGPRRPQGGVAEPQGHSPAPMGGDVKVMRLGGVWVYIDGFGNPSPLGRDTVDFTEEQARERARRISESSWGAGNPA